MGEAARGGGGESLWIHVLWRCRVDQVRYDETRFLATLRKRGSPLRRDAAESAS